MPLRRVRFERTPEALQHVHGTVAGKHSEHECIARVGAIPRRGRRAAGLTTSRPMYHRCPETAGGRSFTAERRTPVEPTPTLGRGLVPAGIGAVPSTMRSPAKPAAKASRRK